MRQDNKSIISRSSSQADATPSIIAAGMEIDGDIKSIGEIHLDGRISGNLTCTRLVMGEQGQISGSIRAEIAIISGTIDGQLVAEEVRLERTAVLDGDVYHKKLSVDSGAKITGRFIHDDSKLQQSTVEITADLELVAEESAATKKRAADKA